VNEPSVAEQATTRLLTAMIASSESMNTSPETIAELVSAGQAMIALPLEDILQQLLVISTVAAAGVSLLALTDGANPYETLAEMMETTQLVARLWAGR